MAITIWFVFILLFYACVIWISAKLTLSEKNIKRFWNSASRSGIERTDELVMVERPLEKVYSWGFSHCKRLDVRA